MTESGSIGTHSTSRQHWRWNRGVTLVFAFHSWMVPRGGGIYLAEHPMVLFLVE